MSGSAQVLIIDDDPQVLRLFKRILTNGGISAVAVESGKNAMDLLRANEFRVVVLDISMPEPDGFEVLKALRYSEQRPRVLAVSGYMRGELLEAAGFLGADATLSKAHAPDLLLDRVSELLR